MPDGSRPLAGRRVLVTRPAGRAEGLQTRLQTMGAVVDLRPTIAFEPPRDEGPVRRALDELHDYDWIVLTSPTGVRRFLGRLGQSQVRPESIEASWAVVGPGTAAALRKAGVEPDVVAGRPDADGLTTDLLQHVASGQRVLVIRPEVARSVLPEALTARGARVDAVPLYRTVATKECASIAEDVIAARYDDVVFTSPSTTRALLDGAGERHRELRLALLRMHRVAIGKVTEAALDDAAVPATAVAAAPTDEAIAEALVHRDGA